MPTPLEILEDHREHLIARLLSRNPLLSFNPTKGYKIDICDLFPQENLPAIFNNDAEREGNEEHSTNASDFFSQLIENGTTSFSLEKPKLARRIRKIRAEAQDLKRATGMDLLYFAWPFIHIPANLCARTKAIAAPLLFWAIKLQLNGQSCTARLLSDEPEYNFILQEWPKLKKNCNLDFSQFEGKSINEIHQLIPAFAENMTLDGHACSNKIIGKDPYLLSPYSDEDGKPSILPTAAFGIANFNSRTLLNNLEKLAKIANAEEDHGLLDIFLCPLTNNNNVRRPDEVSEPNNEADKYLVEKTDNSQEAVVWQARHENAKVMFLKGPPGTGKSQTIVNLIADALIRKESIAVVCHKQAALDVVKKRLDAINLDKLSTKIINPRNERNSFIKGIRDIPLEDYHHPPPNQNNDEIKTIATLATLETDCYQQSELRMSDNKQYSVKGHLRGKIKKLSEETGFNPFTDVGENHQIFIGTIREKIGEQLQNENARENLLESMEALTKNYQDCDFSNNPWQKSYINDTNAVANIQANFEALTRTAQELDEVHDNLPDRQLSALLCEGIMKPWSASFCVGEKRETVAKYTQLIADTKKVFTHANMEVYPKIWEGIYQGEGGAEYRRYANNVRHLPLIASIRSRQRDNGVLNAFMNYKNIKPAHWHDILDVIFCHWRFNNMEVPPRVPPLVNYDENVNKLKLLIDNKRKGDARKVRSQYNKRQVAKNELSDRGLLRLRGGGIHKATTIRELYNDGGGSVKKIYPVLLASPDTVCQITPMKQGYFDLVIIDEASQMFTADALPILYRAKKIIISGDNMQMPPDNTFAMLLNDQDDNDYAEEEQEENTAANISEGDPPASGHYELLEAVEHLLPSDSPARRELNVHYRSRPSELIAFSNHAFYGGKLQAATDNGALPPNFERPFRLLPVAGKFDKGINDIEIISIIETLRELWQVDNPPSVGVIVFNVMQAREIKGRLFEECVTDAGFKEKYDNALSQEDDGEDASFFVRSVEHVQGDERDIIILATTYDDNTRGFGPLSIKEKGRRRLNVAITRAKLGMLVITSLTIDGISNDGQRPIDGEQQEREIWYLWKFMQYVRAVANGAHEKSVEILRDINPEYLQPVAGTGNAESQFELDVAGFIRENGYHVDYQVGEGGFRIDLGIKRHKSDTAYLCGLECDGRIWHDGWRARHNDIWRQGILESKGWTIHRIWSDHWYDSPENTKQELQDKLA